MSSAARVKVFDSQVADYKTAFQVFLDHTDQKTRAKAWLERFVAALPKRGVFLDAGAGEGTLTEFLAPHFSKTIAVEPNAALREALSRRCPQAEVHGDMILKAKPSTPADFILCSHVFYYIPQDQWSPTLEALASWLAPGGTLVILLQNPETDCMKMVRHFLGHRFDLGALARSFTQSHGGTYTAKVETDPANIKSKEFSTAYTVAEFMLNLLPLPNPPLRSELEAYVRENFHRPADGLYSLSCNQDFLQIQRKS